MTEEKTHKCEYPLCSGKTLKELNGYTLCGYFKMYRKVFMAYKNEEIIGSHGTS